MITATDLEQIVGLANAVPEVYRQTCFELLLKHTLECGPAEAERAGTSSQVTGEAVDPANLPIDVKAFFSQHHLDFDILAQLFHIEGGEVRPIYGMHETTRVKAEITTALLLALERALRTGQFQLEIQDLRNRCQELKCYDMANFMRHLRKNTFLFKNVSPDQPLVLSTEGKTRLAELLHRLAA